MTHKLRVLVDSTYILPALGIEVEGIDIEDLEDLDYLYQTGKVLFYYTSIIWIEIIPKVIKEYSRKGLNSPASMMAEIALILKSTFKHIEPGKNAIVEATKLRQLGHKDMIDNILYGVAIENNLYLLTMDTAFKKFLKTHSLRHKILLTHKQLLLQVNG